MNKYFVIPILFFASVSLEAREFIREDIIQHPSHLRFSVCFNNSCHSLAELSINHSQWAQLTADWIPIAQNPSEEREWIKGYIAAMEQLVGPLTGTDHDLPGVFRGAFRSGQMDCIDEATNTTSYLRLLENARLLRWHNVESPRTRFVLPFSWPHTAALIRDNSNNELFIVDSWFEANGEEPHIVSLTSWEKGWKPDQDDSND